MVGEDITHSSADIDASNSSLRMMRSNPSYSVGNDISRLSSVVTHTSFVQTC